MKKLIAFPLSVLLAVGCSSLPVAEEKALAAPVCADIQERNYYPDRGTAYCSMGSGYFAVAVGCSSSYTNWGNIIWKEGPTVRKYVWEEYKTSTVTCPSIRPYILQIQTAEWGN